MRRNDLILFAVVFVSIGIAVALPDYASVFHPFVLYFMMILMFLSFLRMDFGAFISLTRKALIDVAVLSSIKLILLPAVLYWISLFIIPDYAVPILLISGISTGVVAPFIAGLLSAEMALVLRMVIVTSLLVPFTLPVMVKALAGAEIVIPLWNMIRLLALVVFVPMVAVITARRTAPNLLQRVMERQFPISLSFFAVINLGVFSQYSRFIFEYPFQLLISIVVAYALCCIYYVVGYFLIPGGTIKERISGGISLAIMNNVLVIVFASGFFGPLASILAAVYMAPFFTMIVPVKMVRRYLERIRQE
jgi:BASS family bile acid:Na+ symporter